MSSHRLTPNQVVAHNLGKARRLRHWTQEQAAERLEPHLGKRLSKAAYSAAERSWESERTRHFSADELYAFARTFDLPMTFFLIPPREADTIGAGDESIHVGEFLDMVCELDQDTRESILGGTIQRTNLTGARNVLDRYSRSWLALVVDVGPQRWRELLSDLATTADDDHGEGR